MGRAATAAAESKDSAKLYRLFRELRLREYTARRDGGQQAVADPDAEREAWAAHFKKVSETRGVVHPRV